jgi:hypothetical protein
VNLYTRNRQTWIYDQFVERFQKKKKLIIDQIGSSLVLLLEIPDPNVLSIGIPISQQCSFMTAEPSEFPSDGHSVSREDGRLFELLNY